MRKFLVLGLPVHISDDYLGWLKERLADRQGAHVVTINSEMAMLGRKNSELAAVIRCADLVIPDGSGVALFLRSQGEMVSRCPGIELSESLVALAAPQEWQVFLIGGAVGMAQTVADKWQKRFSGLAIAGVQDGYFDPDQEKILCQRLQDAQPEIILVGLGVPKQEFWIRDHRYLCPHAVWIGVGGSLDVWSGCKARAPKWLRDRHLEWVYRLYKEPWRWKRMLALPHCVLRVTWQALTNGKNT